MQTKPILVAGLLALLAALTPASASTILHTFIGSDGSNPFGSLTLSGAKLYGMAEAGGSSNSGTLFSMNTDGTGFGLLHTFTGGAGDGSYPHGSLTLSGATLYGMTEGGGSSDNGALFSVNTNGTGYGLLHIFAGGASDGGNPTGSLTLSGAKLYGMTQGGGSSNRGTLFSMNTDGSGFGLLHTFTGGAGDGRYPRGALTLSGSKLYGMTEAGGSSDGGALFSMNTDGTGYGLLHIFTGGASDGSSPLGSLTLSGSKLYGMTAQGGSSGNGTIFSMNTDGTGFGLLHAFTGSASDGRNPFGSLTLSGSMLYGMTSIGGSSGNGTIFSIGTDGTGFGLLESLGVAPADGAVPQLGDLTLSGDSSTLYGMTYAGGTANNGVVFSKSIAPEPGTFALFGLGTLLLAARRRRDA